MRWSSKALAFLFLASASVALGQQLGSPGGSGSGSGSVTQVNTTCGVSGGPITTTGTITASLSPRNNTATTDTITSTDCGSVVTESNTVPVAVAITTAGFSAGNYVGIKNLNSGVATYTPSTGAINGASSYTLSQGQFSDIYLDASGNWQVLDTGIPTYASGIAALGTSSISSATCASAITIGATPVATTDAIIASFNADPTSSTGFIPSTSGGLVIFIYPTLNNVNFKVCNSTASSITPSPVTLNWRVVR